MIAYVNGAAVMMCDYCYVRGPKGHSRDIPTRPPRWGVRRVGDQIKHACAKHTRQLKADANG